MSLPPQKGTTTRQRTPSPASSQGDGQSLTDNFNGQAFIIEALMGLGRFLKDLFNIFAGDAEDLYTNPRYRAYSGRDDTPSPLMPLNIQGRLQDRSLQDQPLEKLLDGGDPMKAEILLRPALGKAMLADTAVYNNALLAFETAAQNGLDPNFFANQLWHEGILNAQGLDQDKMNALAGEMKVLNKEFGSQTLGLMAHTCPQDILPLLKEFKDAENAERTRLNQPLKPDDAQLTIAEFRDFMKFTHEKLGDEGWEKWHQDYLAALRGAHSGQWGIQMRVAAVEEMMSLESTLDHVPDNLHPPARFAEALAQASLPSMTRAPSNQTPPLVPDNGQYDPVTGADLGPRNN